MTAQDDIREAVRSKVAAGNYRLSVHAEKEREHDHVGIREIEDAMAHPELVQDYPNDPRGHSCLLLGFTREGKPIHVVAGELIGEEPLVIITLYRPDPDQWENWRTRR